MSNADAVGAGILPAFKYILASQSPRRRQLLADLGIQFDSCSLDADESFDSGLKGSAVALYLAEKKANAYPTALAIDELLITADTIVCIGDVVLNKPADKAQAKFMLEQLSGKTHHVFTGVCLKTAAKTKSFVVGTAVTFAALSSAEMGYYIDKFQPLDKAGAYGVQEWIGYIGVSNINGSYFNVMGLPVHELYQALKHWHSVD